MPKVDFNVNVDRLINAVLKDRGFNRSERPAVIRAIKFEFYAMLADDIRNRRTGWAVDTGYSRASFYAQSDGLYNHASYAQYVENATDAIHRYVSTNGRSLVIRALEFTGITPTKSRSAVDIARRLTIAAILSRESRPLLFRPFLQPIFRDRR